MSRPERNGFSRAAESSLLAERLQVDRGSVPRRARDPHAELKTKIHRTCHRPARQRLPQPRGKRRTCQPSPNDRQRGADRRGGSAQPGGPRRPRTADRRRHPRLRAAGALPRGPERHRSDGQRLRPGLHRAGRPDRGDPDVVPRRRPPAADHRPHRLAGRAAHRRSLADGRRAPARRKSRQRDHSPARAPRSFAHDPQVRPRRAHARAPRRLGTLTEQTAEFLAECVRGSSTSSSPAAPAPERRRC